MTPTGIFAIGLFVSVLCLAFAIVSIYEVKRLGNDAEARRNDPAGAPDEFGGSGIK